MTSSPEELRELRAAVRGFLDQHAPVRSQLSGDATTWKRLSEELGLTALPVAEQLGGAGASFLEVAVVLEETGRSLLRAPYLSTVVAAAVLQELGAEDELPSVADGSAPVALALHGSVRADSGRLTGTLEQVVDAAESALLLVASGDALHLLPRDGVGVTVTPLEVLDPTRPQARVALTQAPSRPLGNAETVSRAVDLHSVALAAECVGAAGRCLEMAVEHLKSREQFGRPLGSFQALRHRIADLTVLLEGATSTAWYAVRAAAGRSDDLAVAAPLAHATCVDAFRTIAGESIQLHGGIGFTWEPDAHLYFKRAWTTALLHGEPRVLRARAAARAGVLNGGDLHG